MVVGVFFGVVCALRGRCFFLVVVCLLLENFSSKESLCIFLKYIQNNVSVH
jgi:hypothetical protein